jgi:hypothetical protein
MNSRLLALAAALCTAVVCLGASIASADVTQTEDLLIETGDTPKVGLKQTSASGFVPYAWDIAGNEANFFVRDVTGGKLLFRMRPGAPSNSLTVGDDGNVGLGLIDAGAPLQISQAGAVNIVYSAENAPVGSANWSTGILADGSSFTIGLDGAPAALTLAPRGDLGLLGSLTEAAAGTNVANFQSVDAAAILQKLEKLPLRSWTYAATPGSRHLGPLAGDFASAFGLGGPAAIAPGDVAGVSLAGIQALIAQNQALSTRVQSLERHDTGQDPAVKALTVRADATEAANAALRGKVNRLAKQMKKLRKAVAQLAR